VDRDRGGRALPQARLCLDPSTSPGWATDALDQVRREVGNAAPKHGQTALARQLKGARSGLWKNPGDLTARQRANLAWIARVNDRLDRASLLQQALRLVFTLKAPASPCCSVAGLAWPWRCCIPALVDLAKAIARHRADLQAALTKACQRPRGGPGHQALPAHPGRVRPQVPQARIALAMLGLGGLCPPLPGRG
jgi:transposase